ncbi:MAG: glycoside hydrolase family protein [Planctomycetota bacterium]
MKAFGIGLIVLILLTASTVKAFNGHIVTEGPLQLTIDNIEDVTEYDKPREVKITVKNNSDSPMQVLLRMADLVDECYAVGQMKKQLSIAADGETETTFRIAVRKGAFSALYPVHIYATFRHEGQTVTAHAVQIFKSNFEKAIRSSSKPDEMPTNIVPANGALPLCPLKTHRVTWNYYDKPLVYMPVGWQGSSTESSASFSIHQLTRGTSKHAIHMHPPWRPAGGTVFAEYLLKLPDVVPIKLTFANAIRDHTETEPPSDGVTFRVWAGDRKLFERHTDSKKWLDGQADLSSFAGKKILLRLESHPGPKRNTTCDSSYWGEPTIIAGTLLPQLTEVQREELRKRAAGIIKSQKVAGRNEFVFKLEDNCTAAIVLGKNGLADAAIAFGEDQHCVVFDGLNISVLRNKFGREPSQLIVRKVETKKDRLFGKLSITHHLSFANEDFTLTAEVWKDKAGLRIKLQCPKRITDIALGQADQKAPRVYYGHGYCIVEPKAFRANFGGHNLSTSHVGFDFDKGISLLTASDNPPDYLEVDPGQRIYALHTHLDSMMTFVPSTKEAFDCARKYGPLFDKKPAAGLKNKAGRFVFDIWGGRYAEIAETMKQMINYGLTDSLLTVHVWQRWGYDYRLPDIYPPLPSLGTIEDMQQIAKVCAEHDIPWGLHDNYIDIYPDATDYSYNHICFTEQGEPIKAWLNEGRDAQSYRWRPDYIMPFIKRNLKLIKPNLKPTHYFIDVFTSLPCFDFYDRDGNFHSMLETRKCWGEVFAWIRDYLGDNAPTTSEAGHDQLIGYLDGSDCQHLQLSPVNKRFCIRLDCKDWERVPWFDTILHDKFSLHGVGYSSRYQGGRPRRDHGIESDDYISAEVLEGHALMIDRPAFGRGAIRKYWLAQDFIRSIDLDSIEDVDFIDGDIHRQLIKWKSGAQVFVNRGDKDWQVGGKTLPQYGYFAKNGQIESSIEKINGILVEQSRGPSRCYFNARGFSQDATLAISPTADSVEYLGDRRFKLIVNWNVQRAAPKNLQIFIHFNNPKSERPDKIAFQSGGNPAPGTSKWAGSITTGGNWIAQIPRNYGAGEYKITIGLWNPSTGRRFALYGDDDGSARYNIGKLVAEGTDEKITNIRLVKHIPKPQPPLRWNVGRIPIDFGPIVTEGAFRCQLNKNTIVVTPLPGLEPFMVTLRTDKLTGTKDKYATSVTAIDADGKDIRNVEFDAQNTWIQFQTREDEFAYKIVLKSL